MTSYWSPCLESAEVKKGPGTLLWEARGRLFPFGERHIRGFRDGTGTVALEYPGFVLVAKSYVYGNIVSAHKSAVHYAAATMKKLVMYVADTGAFYEFSPPEVIRMSTPNVRGREEMLNFPVRLGKRVFRGA